MTEKFKKSFCFRGYLSGEDDDGFCFAVPPEDYEAIAGKWNQYNLSSHDAGLLNLFPSKLMSDQNYELDHQAYQFKITVEAIPIDASALPARLPKVLKMFKARFGRFIERDALANLDVEESKPGAKTNGT